jgi:hypothetical protein
MRQMQPRMRVRLVGARIPGDGHTVAVDERGEVEIAAPGVLGGHWGDMTPVGFVRGHLAYGLVLALVYGAVA